MKGEERLTQTGGDEGDTMTVMWNPRLDLQTEKKKLMMGKIGEI